MKKKDYTAIKEYQQGKITQEEAADRLCCTVDWVDEFIRRLTEDANDEEQERESQIRRYGASSVERLEDMNRLDFTDGSAIKPLYYGRI